MRPDACALARVCTSGKLPDGVAFSCARKLRRRYALPAHSKAPAYLRPSTQLKLLHTTSDCLAVPELAVNWEAEKLYGVEALGPFDEFGFFTDRSSA